MSECIGCMFVDSLDNKVELKGICSTGEYLVYFPTLDEVKTMSKEEFESKYKPLER